MRMASFKKEWKEWYNPCKMAYLILKGPTDWGMVRRGSSVCFQTNLKDGKNITCITFGLKIAKINLDFWAMYKLSEPLSSAELCNRTKNEKKKKLYLL